MRAEADLSALPAGLAPVAQRLVHACGMPDIVPDLAWRGDPAAAGRAALQAGAPVLADCRMVVEGITRARLPADNQVLCTLRDERVPGLAKAQGTTRSAAAVELWRPNIAGAVVAIGNAPTALFRLLELLLDGWPAPAVILGFPVGFVGAAESKDALIASDIACPCLDPEGPPRRQRAGGRRGQRARGGKSMTPWLSIVGLGEDGLAGLSPAARPLVADAQVLIGGARHLAMVPDDGRERLTWTSPLTLLLDQVAERRGRRVCVLATGDPLHYGIGVSLLRRVPREEVVVIPAPSAFSLAAARMGWSLSETATLTVHGRPLALLQAHIQPGAKLLILSEDGATPGQVAALLTARGYGDSRLTVLAHMGGPKEARRDAVAKAFDETAIADLNTIAVACVAGPDAKLLPRVPGLPDEAFRHDGQLTKREVRAATLAALAPVAGQFLWDVGAGCGSVAIEWLRAAPGAAAWAVERSAERRALIADNATALGAPELKVIPGDAPDALGDLPPPDAVFVGGGATAPGLLAACWHALTPGGRLVANVVTLEGEQALSVFRESTGGQMTRIAVSRAEPVGGFTGWRPLMPVTQLTAVKP